MTFFRAEDGLYDQMERAIRERATKNGNKCPSCECQVDNCFHRPNKCPHWQKLHPYQIFSGYNQNAWQLLCPKCREKARSNAKL